MIMMVEKIQNGYLVRIEQEDEPDWKEGGSKSQRIMGTDVPAEKIWFAKNKDEVFTIQDEHYFNVS